jgi:hypothetical protein
MLKSLLVPAFIVLAGTFTAAGCTDNSGNGHYNPDAATGNGGSDGGSDGVGTDGASDLPGDDAALDAPGLE